MKRREPGILKLTKIYNDLCKQMRGCVQRQRELRHPVLPQPLDPKKLFELNVDDDIWQDAGLLDDEDGLLPLWLCDPAVRDGVKNMLILDRCLEEESRLRKERTSMQQWLLGEWHVLQVAYDLTGVLGLVRYSNN